MDRRERRKARKQGRRNAVRFVAFLIVFLCCFAVLQYFLSPDYDVYNGGRTHARISIHEMYTSDRNIDMLVLGSSHAMWQHVPSILDESFNVHSYNAGTSAQALDTSFAMLVEAGKNNKIDTVFLELCPARKGEVYSDRKDLTKIYVASDYLHFGLNKIKHLLNASSEEYYINSFFPLLRTKKYYLDPEYLINSVKRRFDPGFINYEYPADPKTAASYLSDRGYMISKNRVEDENWSSNEKHSPISDDFLSSDEKKSVEDIIGYCRNRGIKLIILSTPVTDFNLTQYGNYDNGREQIRRFVEDHDVEYYDFNLCKPEYFEYESSKFFDSAHMNKYGAEEYSRLIGKFFTGKLSEEDLFYNSYEEKLSAMGNRVFGLIYKTEEKGNERIIHFDPMCSAEFPVYVNVKSTSSDGTEKVLQSRELLKDAHLAAGETGTLTIEVLGDSPEGEITNTITIDY